MSNRTIASVDTPDPWMIAHDGVFYLTFTLGNRISIWKSPNMEDFHDARKSIIYKPEPGSPWSKDLWAPELHRLNDAWYIYATAGHPGQGNEAHRTILLRSQNPDPMHIPSWNFLGPLKGMPEWRSIDATVFHTNPQDLYICWSGRGDINDPSSQQNLYVKQMVSPEEVVPEHVMKAVCIARPDQDWERFDHGKKGICEGPTWLNLPGGAFTGIVYSGHASFTSHYALGLLRLVRADADPLDHNSWVKRRQPLLMNDQSRPGPYAPGHASFIHDPRPGFASVFCIYHATENWGEGFKNRKARVMYLGPDTFRPDSRPVCCSYGPGHPPQGGQPQAQEGGHHGQDENRKEHPTEGKIMDKLKKWMS